MKDNLKPHICVAIHVTKSIIFVLACQYHPCKVDFEVAHSYMEHNKESFVLRSIWNVIKFEMNKSYNYEANFA